MKYALLALMLFASNAPCAEQTLADFVKTVNLDGMIKACASVILDLGLKPEAETALNAGQADWLKAAGKKSDNLDAINRIKDINSKNPFPRVALYGITLVTPRTSILRFSTITPSGPIVISVTTFEHDTQGPKIGAIALAITEEEILRINKDCQYIEFLNVISIKRTATLEKTP
jgi:hypothetical protein